MPSPTLFTAALTAALAFAVPPAGAVAADAAGTTRDSAYAVSAETADPSAGATTWTLEPASADGPDGRVSLRHVIDPGSIVEDHVTVTNFSAEPAVFALYASDGVISPTGDFDLLPPGAMPVDGGSWISIGAVEGATPRDGGLALELPAGGSATVPLTITVPEDALPGDHPAGVVAELTQDDGGAVRLTSRVGVRAHLRVAGDVVASLQPDEVSATWIPSWNPFAPGSVEVTFSITNDGNVRLGADSAVSLTGPFGLAPAEATTTSREVLPRQEMLTTVTVPAWPLVLGTGSVDLAPLVVGEDEITAPAAASASFTVWTIPWVQLALIILLVGGFLLLRLARRRSAARVQARIDAAVAAARTTEQQAVAAN
ncbi:hypothetical protein HF576_11520 [Microbacterium sp. CFH 90308]|uniref:DUF916 domain-containing protein n=1 Tax=Microbacterium salsuginis TaxID=2722803 RepID=A0ABX1KBS1_9MICO|nr:hypothetical protein [Microbacterium sp. CFH 90308]NLP84479.1 hypothetical protein [Microbacterium sp. CFH 90308]